MLPSETSLVRMSVVARSSHAARSAVPRARRPTHGDDPGRAGPWARRVFRKKFSPESASHWVMRSFETEVSVPTENHLVFHEKTLAGKAHTQSWTERRQETQVRPGALGPQRPTTGRATSPARTPSAMTEQETLPNSQGTPGGSAGHGSRWDTRPWALCC